MIFSSPLKYFNFIETLGPQHRSQAAANPLRRFLNQPITAVIVYIHDGSSYLSSDRPSLHASTVVAIETVNSGCFRGCSKNRVKITSLVPPLDDRDLIHFCLVVKASTKCFRKHWPRKELSRTHLPRCRHIPNARHRRTPPYLPGLDRQPSADGPVCAAASVFLLSR